MGTKSKESDRTDVTENAQSAERKNISVKGPNLFWYMLQLTMLPQHGGS